MMAKDKYTSKTEVTVFLILQILWNAREKIFTNSLLFIAWDVFF